MGDRPEIIKQKVKKEEGGGKARMRERTEAIRGDRRDGTRKQQNKGEGREDKIREHKSTEDSR